MASNLLSDDAQKENGDGSGMPAATFIVSERKNVGENSKSCQERTTEQMAEKVRKKLGNS